MNEEKKVGRVYDEMKKKAPKILAKQGGITPEIVGRLYAERGYDPEGLCFLVTGNDEYFLEHEEEIGAAINKFSGRSDV